MITLRKRVVGVIGQGHVGAHVAFNLGMMGIADEVLLCDVNDKKAASEEQDLMDAMSFMPHRVEYKLASYEDLGRCDIIVNAAGKVLLCGTGNRDDEMNFTCPEVYNYIPKVMKGGFNGIFVNITNPCDVITNIIAEQSGLPKNHVLGTGTGLDTARLLHWLTKRTGISPSSISAYMIGEHGNAQMTPWSQVSFGGKRLDDMPADDPRFNFDRDEAQTNAIRGGWVTFAGKRCTEYGISSIAATLVRAIYQDEKLIWPCSAWLDGQYGESGIYIGVPCVIGSDGVEEVVELPLPEDEMTKFKQCCETVRNNITRSRKVIAATKHE
jgi:L-lactate dehydrogenase